MNEAKISAIAKKVADMYQMWHPVAADRRQTINLVQLTTA